MGWFWLGCGFVFIIIIINRDMCQTLNLDQEEGEKWIVNLIRDTRVDAKIDFEEVSSGKIKYSIGKIKLTFFFVFV